MSNLPLFTMGQPASASMMMQAFNVLEDQGSSIIGILADINTSTLVDYQIRLTALESRQRQQARILQPGVPARFVLCDLVDIDQGSTTATIRIDSGTACLRERRDPNQILVSSTSFNSSTGTTQSIDSDSTLFSVYSDSVIPVGTFSLTLASTVGTSFLTIDLSPIGPSPSIEVSVSENGVEWVQATKVILSGSIVSVWMPQTATKYIQVVMTPSGPDNLGGSTYTFGITGLSGVSVTYNLVSDVYYKPISFLTSSTQVMFEGNSSEGLSYYLTLDSETKTVGSISSSGGSGMTPGTYPLSFSGGGGGSGAAGTITVTSSSVTSTEITDVGSDYLSTPVVTVITGGTSPILTALMDSVLVTTVISPGSSISLPGVSASSFTPITSSGILSYTLPSNYIPNTIRVADADENNLPVLVGLSVSDPNIANITSPVVSLVGNTLTVIPHPVDGTAYTVNFLTGSPTITATLQVHLTTSDNSITPIFNGAYLANA